MGISSIVDPRFAGLAFVIGLIYIVLGFASLLLSRGYWKGQEWARRKGRTVALVAMLIAILGLFIPAIDKFDAGSPVLTILGCIVIIAYLGTDGVKAYFASRSRH